MLLGKFYHGLCKRGIKYLTASSRVLPDFLIIGAKRCGTTSLFQHLPEHPSIAKSDHDNMGFFNDNFNLGINWYKSFFPTISEKNQIQKRYGEFRSFDVTTTYMEHSFTAQNIKKINQYMKIIIMLRNPIDRLYSQFHVSVKENEEKDSFEDAISEELDRLRIELTDDNKNLHKFNKNHRNYLKKSLYAMQLRPWFELFPKKNILVLSTEDFKINDEKIYNEIFDFLGISNFKIKNTKHMEKGNYLPIDIKIRQKLIEFFKPHNDELFELIEKKFNWDY